VPRRPTPDDPHWAPSKELVSPRRDWPVLILQALAILVPLLVALTLGWADMKADFKALQVEMNAEGQAWRAGDANLEKLMNLRSEPQRWKHRDEDSRATPPTHVKPPAQGG
jgi:hypothetical protein